ncbi:GNAT family N-acetyltransferase [Mesobacillus harenae]|uniref:GNAT family N-acetyltransferase n=1 Tax=Mesobacillus harenae TaxID=2213203 RepID=UPI0015801A85|nr:GNAT family N-acetyltransferase [Mesobacillus harenae]
MDFKPIDIHQHQKYVIPFRRDSFVVSFGTDMDFGEEQEYLDWLKQQSAKYPEGFVLVFENDIAIGQLELTMKQYEGKDIGYVNLYYLIPEKRGMGLGSKLHDYALNFFKANSLKEYHLRVSPSNQNAVAFYQKNGMKKIRSEVDGKVIRMSGKIPW